MCCAVDGRLRLVSNILLSEVKTALPDSLKFRIADTFTDSLARLTGEEQKAVKTTAFDLQLNPSNPGMRFHKLDKARDRNFWSVRVNSDIRLIVHKAQDSLLLCYVGHHDKAYDWAERRRLETHPKTGAAQLVEVRETIQEIRVPKYVDQPAIAPSTNPLFSGLTDDELLGFGVPTATGWMRCVRPMRIRCWPSRIICLAKRQRLSWSSQPEASRESRRP